MGAVGLTQVLWQSSQRSSPKMNFIFQCLCYKEGCIEEAHNEEVTEKGKQAVLI